MAVALNSQGAEMLLHINCTKDGSPPTEKVVTLNGYGNPSQDTFMVEQNSASTTMFITTLAYCAEEPNQSIVYLRIERQKMPLILHETSSEYTNIIAYAELHLTNGIPMETAINTIEGSNHWGNAVIMLEDRIDQESQQGVPGYRRQSAPQPEP